MPSATELAAAAVAAAERAPRRGRTSMLDIDAFNDVASITADADPEDAGGRGGRREKAPIKLKCRVGALPPRGGEGASAGGSVRSVRRSGGDRL